MNSYPCQHTFGMDSEMVAYLKEARQVGALKLTQHIRLRKPHVRKQKQPHPKRLLLDHQLDFSHTANLLSAVDAIDAITHFPVLLCDLLAIACDLPGRLVRYDQLAKLDS